MKTPGRLRPHRVLRGSGIWESICHLGGFKERALYWQRNQSPSAWKASVSLLFLWPPHPSHMGTWSLLAHGHPHTPILTIFAVLGIGYNVSCMPLQKCPPPLSPGKNFSYFYSETILLNCQVGLEFFLYPSQALNLPYSFLGFPW